MYAEGEGTTFDSCIISDNTAQVHGGGSDCGTPKNCLLAGNRAATYGGGAFRGTLENCTITDNEAGLEGGGCHDSTLINSIIYFNSATNAGDNWRNHGALSVSYSCTTPTNGIPGGTGNVIGDPLFINASGGNYRLNSGSPCINAGTNQAWMAGAVDLDGNPRSKDRTVDVGGYEKSLEHTGHSPEHFVSLTGGNTHPYTNWATAARSIQDAVDTASAGDTVLVMDGVYKPGTQLVVTNAVTLRSVYGAPSTIVDGQHTHRCFYIGGDAVISGFTIANGRVTGAAGSDGGPGAPGGTGSDAFGGGVFCVGSGAIQNCTISSNAASGGQGAPRGSGDSRSGPDGDAGSGYGGGAYCDQGGTLQNTIIHFNSASTSGDNWHAEGAGVSFSHCCTTPTNGLPGGAGCIAHHPQLDVPTPRLLLGSPCIDAGTNAYAAGTADLDGNPRILDGDADGSNTVDMGAYEFVSSAADSDGDGLTDGDEVDTHGTDPSDANTDDDPYTDGEEYIADTDGTNPDDYFRITGVAVSSPVTVTFESSANRRYTMDGCSNLLEGAWTNVPGAGPRMGVGGADIVVDVVCPHSVWSPATSCWFVLVASTIMLAMEWTTWRVR